MMLSDFRWQLHFAAIVACLVLASPSLAQTVTLQVAPANINFDLTPGTSTNPADQPISIMITWAGLKNGSASWSLAAFFDTGIALRPADPSSSFSIPASAITGTVSGDVSAPTAAFTSTCTGVPNCLLVDSDAKVTGRAGSGTHNDSLSLNINLSGTLASLPPDTYTGTLHIRMAAY